MLQNQNLFKSLCVGRHMSHSLGIYCEGGCHDGKVTCSRFINTAETGKVTRTDETLHTSEEDKSQVLDESWTLCIYIYVYVCRRFRNIPA